MVFDPSADITLTESPEALEAKRKRELDDASLDAKYSDPDVLRSEQAELHRALYTRETTPLTVEQQEVNREQFESLYRADLEMIFNSQAANVIADNYSGSGDIELSIYMLLGRIGTPEENKEEIAESIAEYLDPRITSLRVYDRLNSSSGVEVQAGMNASYINSFLGSNRHIDMSPEADSLNVGDTLRFGEDETMLMRNDTAIGSLNEDNGDLAEIAGREFSESRYTPLIESFTVSDSELTDPLHQISSLQVEEIGMAYSNGLDIVDAMEDILGPDHELVGHARNLDNPDSINERRELMYSDLGVPQELQVDPENPGSGDVFVSLVSENYIQLLDNDGNVDKEASFMLASQTACNKIVEGKHTFTRTLEFEEAYERIRSGENSHQQMRTDLLTVFNAVNGAEGVRGRKNQTDMMRMQNNARQKSMFLASEFQRIQNLLLEASEDTQDPSIIDSGEGFMAGEAGGDVFTAGDLDVGSRGTESSQEAA